MRNKTIYVTPIDDISIISAVTEQTYKFKKGNVYKYCPESGLINVYNGQLFVGLEFRNKFKKSNFFEILLYLICGNV